MQSRRLSLVVTCAALAAAALVTAPTPSVRAVTELDMSGTPLKFVYSATDAGTGNPNPSGQSSGHVVVYRNVATVGGHVVDAVVTTTLAGATIDVWNAWLTLSGTALKPAARNRSIARSTACELPPMTACLLLFRLAITT